MKRIIYQLAGAIILPLFINSCTASMDDDFASKPAQPGGAIELTVSAGDFRTLGTTPDTRATDNGKETTFEDGDLVGVIAVQGNTVVHDNIPYQYNSSNGGSWSFAYGTDGKYTPCYYDPKATYIVYYPYSNTANGVTTIEQLKMQFAPKADQRTKEAYRASDLLVCSSKATSKTLTVELKHAYGSISLSPTVNCTLNDGSNTPVSVSSSRLKDVNLTIGEDICLSFPAADGSFRYILPDVTSGTVRWFYTLGDKSFGSSKDFNGGVTANTRYVQNETINAGEFSLSMAQAGDFYCKASESTAYLIPGEVNKDFFTKELKEACLGVVFWVGDPTADDPLLKQAHPSCTHGLVVALHEVKLPNSSAAAIMKWNASGSANVNEWTNHESRGENKVNITATDKMQGYANTKALKAYNDQPVSADLKILPVVAIGQYNTDHPVPAGNSGWYVPSVMELKQVCWGQGASVQSINGRDMLDTQFDKVGGTKFASSWRYWSSSESADRSYSAWYVGFSSGYVDYYGKYGNEFWVRALSAF